MTFRVHPIAIYLLAAALGLMACLNIYDLPFLEGNSPFWQAPHADQMQALTGWYGFAHDSWRFPFFEVKTLRYPLGANIIFTDSIPLLALLMKPFVPILPTDFHYFGWWFALCFILQSVAAVAVLRAWGVRDWLALAAGAIFALSTPAWLIRHHHIALCGHFVVLFALALYARTQHAKSPRQIVAAWVVLLVASTLIHIYLLAMVMALLVAAVLQRAWNLRKQLRSEWPLLLAIPAIAVGSVLGVAFLSGHFRGEAVQDASRGYGIYSMNLLQPWYPQGLLQLPMSLPTLDATGGQYEGFNYLGAGAILLILVALAATRDQWKSALRRHAFLLLTLALLTLFALSNRVYWGDTAVLKYRVPHVIDKPVEIFRSSGRFFWPVGYVLVLGSIVLLARERRHRRWFAAILVAAPLLQWIDDAPARDFPYKDTRQVEPALLPAAVWRPLIAQHSLVRTFPSFFCGPAENYRPSQELQLLSARSGIPITTIFMARQVEDCVAESELMDTLNPGQHELVVYLQPLEWKDARQSFPDPDACRSFPLGFLCSQRFLEPSYAASLGAISPEGYFADLGVAAVSPPSIEPGSATVVTEDGKTPAMFDRGWYPLEADGAWMRGGLAQLRFRLGAAQQGALEFHFRAKAHLSPRHPQRSLTVSANGVRLRTIPIDTWEPRDRAVTIPAEQLSAGGILRIEFAIDPVTSPAADGVSDDSRELGIQLQRVWFRETPGY